MRLLTLAFSLIVFVSPLLVSAQAVCNPACATDQRCVNGQCVAGSGSDNSGGGTDTTGGGTDTSSGIGLVNPLNNIDSFPDLLNAVIGAVVDIGFMLLILMLVYVGFKFVAAQGKEEELRNARSALVWTVIGGLILLGAEAISLVVQSTAGAL